MSIRFMRWVDYWFGVPLTAVLTVYVWIADRLRRRVPLDAVRRVLFLELSEMGSVILADPALRQAGDRREIYFAIFRRNAASLFILNPLPREHVFALRDSSLAALAWDALRLLVWCRRRRIDAVVDMELFSRFTAALSALSGAAVRIGFVSPHSEGLFRGRVLTHPVAYNAREHIARNFLALCDPIVRPGSYRDAYIRRAIGPAELALPAARPSEAALARVRAALSRRLPDALAQDRMLLVNANAGDFLPQRKWPPDHVARFIRLFIARYPDRVVLLTGAPGERASLEAIRAQAASPRCVNIAGDLALEDLPALYALAEAMLTNDSGPAHFAAAVGLRTYVLFGPESPGLYGPLGNAVPLYAGLACSPCVTAANHRTTSCRDNQCLKAMQPEWVLAQIQPHFDGRPRAG